MRRNSSLFIHLVGAAEQRRWNLEAERVGSRHIHELANARAIPPMALTAFGLKRTLVSDHAPLPSAGLAYVFCSGQLSFPESPSLGPIRASG